MEPPPCCRSCSNQPSELVGLEMSVPLGGLLASPVLLGGHAPAGNTCDCGWLPLQRVFLETMHWGFLWPAGPPSCGLLARLSAACCYNFHVTTQRSGVAPARNSSNSLRMHAWRWFSG